MIVELESDWITGELILPIPHEIIVAMEWQEGDTLKWVDNGDGTFSLHSNCGTPECCQEC
jgi:hypothetical protein